MWIAGYCRLSFDSGSTENHWAMPRADRRLTGSCYVGLTSPASSGSRSLAQVQPTVVPESS